MSETTHYGVKIHHFEIQEVGMGIISCALIDPIKGRYHHDGEGSECVGRNQDRLHTGQRSHYRNSIVEIAFEV